MQRLQPAWGAFPGPRLLLVLVCLLLLLLLCAPRLSTEHWLGRCAPVSALESSTAAAAATAFALVVVLLVARISVARIRGGHDALEWKEERRHER